MSCEASIIKHCSGLNSHIDIFLSVSVFIKHLFSCKSVSVSSLDIFDICSENDCIRHFPPSSSAWSHANVASSHSHQPQNEAIPGHQSGDFSILRAASTSNCLRAYRSLLGFAGVSAHCLAGLRWGLKEQMTVKGREAGGWGVKEDWEGRKEASQRRRRRSLSWNEMLCYKAVRVTHLFI